MSDQPADSSDRVSEPTSDQPGQPDVTLDRTIQDRIGAQLRAMYDDIKAEPIPDRFLQLLQQLDGTKRTG